MSEFVVGASVAMKWFVPEDNWERAEQLITGGHRLLAPRFLATETINSAWKNWRKEVIGKDVVMDIAARLEDFIEEWHSDELLFAEATVLALALKHPLYDCLYLALAQQEKISVVTADKRMLAVAPKGLAVSLTDWLP